MLELFAYDFLRRAFIVGTLLAVILPCIGQTVLLKRLSMMGDTLAHSSLAGVAIGLFFGFNPLLGAVVACIIAGLSIEYIRNKLRAYQEISTVVILAASIGLAGLFSGFAGSSKSINAYLFGSIVTIQDSEFYLVIAVALAVIAVYAGIYRQLYLTVFDPGAAHILGINVKLINFIFTFLTAVTISVSAGTIGSLIVSSLLVIPVITAMQLASTYKRILFTAIGLSVLFVYSGLFLSYFYNLRPGSVIVLIAVAALLLILAGKRLALVIKMKRLES